MPFVTYNEATVKNKCQCQQFYIPHFLFNIKNKKVELQKYKIHVHLNMYDMCNIFFSK